MSKRKWSNRIVGSGEVAPDQLLAHPDNFRVHPGAQQAALSGSLDTLGWIQQVIVNKTTGHVVDGHLRVALAMRNGETAIPVLYVELTEAEEAQALLSLDPIAAMAGTDKAKLETLLNQVQTDSETVMQFMADLAAKEGIVPAIEEASEDIIQDKFGVLIECDDEEQQVQLLERFTSEGLRCRALL